MAFDNCRKLKIYAPEGSFAAQYARRNGIPFVAEKSEDNNNKTTATDVPGDFVIENGVLLQYLGPGGDVVIPEGVTAMSPMAFYDCKGLTGITIPEGVTSIGFGGCSNLIQVTIPKSVTSLGHGAFFGCSSLSEVTIPETVMQIGKHAFYGCSSLESIIIPGSVTHIEDETFSSCKGLKTVIFSEGVESIGKNEFFLCDSLKDIYFPASLNKIGRNNYFFRCTIHAPAKSYAAKYAKSHKIGFVVWEKE